MKEKSLKAQILESTSAKKIQELLDRGNKYEFASPSTKRAWIRAAKLRQSQIPAKKHAKSKKSPVSVEA